MTEPVVVPGTLAGERVDRVVALLSGRSRAEVAELVAAGAVQLDGAPVSSRHRRVVAGEVLSVGDGPAAAAPSAVPSPAPEVAVTVVYEDADLLVVDKPPGLVVHPGAGHRDGTLVSGLLARYPDLGAVPAADGWDPTRPGIVHRLDKDTSGLLAVARTPRAQAHLVGQLADRSMGRTYLALVLGRVAADEGTVEAPIGRSTRDPTRMAVRRDGRDARTHYRVLARHDGPVPTTLLELRLETGRTHQIRVHLRAIGHPVAGDARYGGSSRPLALPRPFLHAAALRLVHPTTGELLELSSPLPADLAGVLTTLT
ncbi:MAG: RluA family pseudouridine synthase [Actinomycetota bacterium]|nr:RluA family pseudouridine synthase [Actinomycetota bacterium]